MSPAPPVIVIWKWDEPTYRVKFTAEHVNIFAAMLRRHYSSPHRLVCITDDPEGLDCETFPLWDDLAGLENPSGLVLPRCYRRLKLFSREATDALGIAQGDPVCSIDLDAIIVGDLRPILDDNGDVDFIGWKGVGTYRPVVYNGSLWYFRAGRMQRLWDEFNPRTSPQQTREAKYFGSDQAWVSYKLNGSALGWDIPDGVYAYVRDVRHRPLPPQARIVFFNGKWKPWDERVRAEAPWVAEHWRM